MTHAEVEYYSTLIKEAFIKAGLDPKIIKKFLDIQLDIVMEVNRFNKEGLPPEYIQNAILITQASMLRDLL